MNTDTAGTHQITEQALNQFIGTECYYWSDFKLLKCTDGVQFLRDNGAAWLITAIESYQTERNVKRIPFQLWMLETNGSKAVLTCREDSGLEPIVTQHIPLTDFPLPKIKIYVIDGVVLLPSEY